MCYVTNRYSDTVSIIDTFTNQVVATLATGAEPQGIAISSKTNFVYICNSDSDTLTIIDPTKTKSSSLKVGSFPQQIVLFNDSSQALITTTTEVLAFDLTYNVVFSAIQKELEDLAFTPDELHLYATDLKNNKVYVYDATTYEVKATIPTDPGPSNIAIRADGKYAYVTHFYASATNGYPDYSDTVSVIDISMNRVVNKIRVGTCPLGIDILPNGKFAYVVGYRSNNVSIVDLDLQATTKSIYVDNGPSAISISSDGLYAYVTNTNSQTVSVIETTSNTVTTTISVGSNPQGVTLIS